MRTNVTYAKLDLYIRNEPSTVSRVQMTPEIHNEKTTCMYLFKNCKRDSFEYCIKN